jgi:hypothetical protein
MKGIGIVGFGRSPFFKDMKSKTPMNMKEEKVPVPFCVWVRGDDEEEI